MSTINADRNRREVVWRMSPDDARDLADFTEDALAGLPNDLAHRDVADLRAAADRLDPPREETP